jgi:VanZ family protein
MVVIFYFSHQPVNKSSELSEGVTSLIVDKLEDILKTDLDNELFEHLIRKIAHFTEHMILGILMYIAFSKNNVPYSRKVLVCVIICVLYAFSDEIHQYFVPGRAARLMDVAIDSAGAISGVFITRLFIE